MGEGKVIERNKYVGEGKVIERNKNVGEGKVIERNKYVGEGKVIERNKYMCSSLTYSSCTAKQYATLWNNMTVSTLHWNLNRRRL